MRQAEAVLLTFVAAFPIATRAAPGDPRAPEADAETGRSRLFSARIAPVGEWRLGLSLGGFTSDTFPRPGTEHSQTTGRLALAAAFEREWEAFAQVGLVANRNEGSIPRLIQAVGDVTAGAKWARDFGEFVRAGAVLSLALPAGTGSVSLAPSALGASLAVLGALHGEIDAKGEPWALSLTGQAGAMLDRSAGLLPAGREVTLVQEYSLGVSRYDRFQAGAVLSGGRAAYAAYLEFHVDAPIGVPDEALAAAASGERVRYPTVVAWRLTPGVRVVPLRGLTLDAACEVGLGGNVVRGFASAPPWALRIGATFALDPVRASSAPEPVLPAPPPIALPEPPPPPLPLPEPELPTTGWIEGRVALASGEPVEGAIVALAGDRGPPVATDANGRFRTWALPPGPVGLIARKAGFAPSTASVVVARGQAVGASLQLEPRPPPPPVGSLVVRVCDTGGASIAAHVRLVGPRTIQRDLQGAGATFADLPPGDYELRAHADGRVARLRRVMVGADTITPAEVCLATLPARSPWAGEGPTLTTDELAFDKTGHLAPGQEAALDVLADALLRRDVLGSVKLEAFVPGGRGKPAVLEAATRARAEAVKAALVARGVREGALEAVGRGAAPAVKKPVRKGELTRLVVTSGP